MRHLVLLGVLSLLFCTTSESAEVSSDEGSGEDSLCWGSWIDQDDPSGTGDWEKRPSIEIFISCDEPTDIECQTWAGVPSSETGQDVTCSLDVGFVCQNQHQKRGESCLDYRVRFLCPCSEEVVNERRTKSETCTVSECGGVVDAKVAPHGQLFINAPPLNQSFRCQWRIRAGKNEHVHLLVKSSSSYFRSLFYVYDGKSRKAPLLFQKRRYRRISERSFVSSEKTMTLFVRGFAGDSVVRQLGVFYRAIEAPESLRSCDFERDSCGWNVEESDWTRVDNRALPNDVEVYRDPESQCKNRASNRLVLMKMPSAPNCPAKNLFADFQSCGVTLISPLMKEAFSMCLTFDYLLHLNSSVYLRVYLLNVQGRSMTSRRFHGTTTNCWRTAFLKIKDNVKYRVKFHVFGLTETNWKTGDIAIDNVKKIACTENLDCAFGDETTCPVRVSDGSGTWLHTPLSTPSPPSVEVEAPSDPTWKSAGCWRQRNPLFHLVSLESHIDLLPTYSQDYSGSRAEKRCAVAAAALGYKHFFLGYRYFAQCLVSSKSLDALSLEAIEDCRWHSYNAVYYKIFNITSSNASLHTENREKDGDSVYLFTLPKMLVYRRSFLTVILSPSPSYSGTGKVCIAFRYKTTFNDSRVIVTEYHVGGSRSRVAWESLYQSMSISSSSWKTAIFEIRLVDKIAQRIRIYPHYDVMRYFGGSFSVKDIKVVFLCEQASNCSLGKGSFCGWETGPKPSVAFYVRHLNGYVRLTSYRGINKLYVFIKSGLVLHAKYRCFSFQHRSMADQLINLGWGRRVQLLVDGNVHFDRELKQANRLLSVIPWQLELVEIPRFLPDSLVQIQILLCSECSIDLKNFVFASQPCIADVDECAVHAKNNCSHTCENTFGGYECSCPSFYQKIGSDNRTCQYECTPPCGSSQTCADRNLCVCPKGYFGYRDCLIGCGDNVTLLTNASGTIQLDLTVPSIRYSYATSDLSCLWAIRAPPNQQVAIEFVKFQSHMGYRCNQYNVSVSSEKDRLLSSPTNTVTACSTPPSKTYVSKGNELFVSYHALGSTRYLRYWPAFVAKYHFTGDCVNSCANLQWWQTCCPTYVVASPNVLRQGSKADVHIMTQGIGDFLNLQARLVSNFDVALTSLPMKPLENGYGLASFEIPEDFLPGKYQLVIDGITSDNITQLNGMTDVGVTASGPVIFVQTDKPVYKPGQQVRMRIIALNYAMKPHSGNISVEIADGKGTRVLQWAQLRSSNGVARLSFHLSSEPVAGSWTVFVYALYSWSIDPVLINEACFTVQEYVLPKFEVDLLLPQYVLSDDQLLSGTVIARYTYGKPVKGQACLHITSVHQKYFSYRHSPSKETACIKTNGSTEFAIDTAVLVREWFSGSYNLDFYAPIALEVNVTVTEQGTGAIANSSQIVTVARQPYAIKFVPGTSSYYTPGLPFTVTISLVLPDLRPFLNRTLLHVGIRGDGRTINSSAVEAVNGSIQFFVYEESNQFYRNMEITARFSVERKHFSASHSLKPRESVESGSVLSLMSSELVLQPGNETFIDILSSRPLATDFHFLIVARGEIFRSWKSPMQFRPSNDYAGVHESQLAMNVSCALAPSFYLVAYYVGDGNIGVGTAVKFQVARCFQNEVNISFSTNTSRPADQVQLSVKAAPFAHVSVTAVDRSVYLVPSACSGSHLSAEYVLSAVESYNSGYSEDTESTSTLELTSGSGDGYPVNDLFWWKSWWADVNLPEFLKNPGLAIITNLKLSTDFRFVKRQIGGSGSPSEDSGDESDGLASVRRVRSYFPEAWLWDDQQADSDGNAVFNVTVPDTITTWIAEAFAVSSSSGFGLAPAPARLVAFKPFFVSLSLPYSVIRGEEVAILVTVFNYFYEDLKVLIVLDAQTGGFEFIGNASDVSVFISAQNSRTVRFPIVPLRLGRVPLKITAYSTIESDAVIRMILVEPEGKEESYFSSVLLTGNQTESFSLSLPSVIVNGSEKGVVSISGDFMGPALASLGGLLVMPYGCGEQNIASFSPSVMVKRYLQVNGLLTDAIDRKATRYMQIGYQRQLTYKRNDYSYAAWGQRSSFGSTCLTTFVLRIYAQASSVMYIDRTDMAQSACWIVNQQLSDGSFVEPGRCHHLTCGRENLPVALTAYSLMTLVEVNSVVKLTCSKPLTGVISSALRYLKSTSRLQTNVYLMALTAYSLVVGNDIETANVLLQKLEKEAYVKDSQKYWLCSRGYHYRYVSPGSIEATAYVMLAYVEKGDILSAVPIQNWLLAQMDARGGWRSSQDSIIALMALSLMSIKTGKLDESSALAIELNVPGKFYQQLSINSRTAIITRRFEIPVPSTLQVQSVGNRVALVQATVTYNVPLLAPELSFEINTTIRNSFLAEENVVPFDESDRYDDNRLELRTCVRWNRKSDSSMCIVEIGFLSGFSVDKGGLSKLIDDNEILLQRYEIEARKLVLYFDEIRSARIICFNTSFQRSHCVSKLQPAFIRAYAYYEPDFMTVISYDPPATISASLDECKTPSEQDELDDKESSSSGQNESLTEPTLKTTSEEDEAFLDSFV